jgi:hypothetical protein
MGETVAIQELLRHVEEGKRAAAIESGVDWNVFLVDDISKSILPTRHDVGVLNRFAGKYRMDFESDADFVERAMRDGRSYERDDRSIPGSLATRFGGWFLTRIRSRVSGRASTDAAVDGVVRLPFELDAPVYNLPEGVDIRYRVYRLESPQFEKGRGLDGLYTKGRRELREPYIVKVKV